MLKIDFSDPSGCHLSVRRFLWGILPILLPFIEDVLGGCTLALTAGRRLVLGIHSPSIFDAPPNVAQLPMS
jgi:hypothetical protein